MNAKKTARAGGYRNGERMGRCPEKLKRRKQIMTDTKEDYKHLRSIADDPPRGKFVALFDDGSGASLFRFSGDTLYTEEGGIYAPEDGETHADVLIDFGYSHWLPLPDDYKVWGEA